MSDNSDGTRSYLRELTANNDDVAAEMRKQEAPQVPIYTSVGGALIGFFPLADLNKVLNDHNRKFHIVIEHGVVTGYIEEQS